MIDYLGMDEWIAFDRAHRAPTFFARPAWAQALAKAFPALEPTVARVRIDDATSLVPLMRARHPKLRFTEAIAFPLGGYTCVLDGVGQLADTENATRAVTAIAQAVDHLRIIPWPLGPQPRPAIAVSRQAYETAVIDCTDGYDALIARMRGVTRRMAGQAQRRGVLVERCEKTPDQIDAYYAMLCDAAIGWGRATPSFSKSLLEAVFTYGGDDAELWFATVEGERIAGGVVLYGGDELFFWSAAMRRSHAQYRPSNALNLALMRAACDRGVRWYNLGASDGLEGVSRFKHDLGATGVPYAEFEFRRPRFAAYQSIRRALVPAHRGA